MHSKSPKSPPATANAPADAPNDPQVSQKLKKLGELFSLMGPDPEQNIHIIVQQAYQLLSSACSLYNRIDDHEASLACWSGYNLPPGFPAKDKAAGHICFEATIQSGNRPVILEDLTRTPFYESDPYVRQYGLKSYLGYPVYCRESVIGALCVVDTQVRRFNDIDIYIISTLAKFLSLEEERKQAQAALRQSEAKHRRLHKMLRLMADNVPDLIWAKDLDDRYMFANQALCDKLLQCRHPDEAIGNTEAYFAEKERKLGHQHTFGDGAINSDEITKLRKSAGRFLEEGLVRNHYLMLDVHKAPFWDDNGQLIGTVGCARDVTREKQTARALQESEQRYKDLYQNAPVMLYSLDSEDRITSVSNMWLETMGYQREEVIGRSAFDFFTSQSRRDAIENSFPAFYKSGAIKNRPYQFVARQGEIKDILLSAIAQRDARGNYSGALAFIVDVTQNREAEKDQRRLAARLQQAQKMESIATLAGGIAHQFNNALAVILGNLELIQMDGLADAKIMRFVEPIQQAGHKMVQLTSQLLAYARGGKFQTQTVASHHFVRETLSLVNHSLSPYVELETELEESTDPIEVDSTQMQMLLAAILSNASEAIEEKGTVRVKLRNVDVLPDDCIKYQGLKPGRHVLLSITDTGKGMDQKTLERVFEPFYTTKFQGRGLGMAAVYGIVKKHGGFVYVASELGKGTTVSIYLPCASAADAAPGEPVKPLHTGHGTGMALIIEDEELVMEVNRAIVEKLGYGVLEAKSGKEALQLAEEYPDAIAFALLDVVLPDMSGNQIYPKLKDLRPDLKVIVCSGFTLDGPAREIINAGAESFLPKPFSVAALSAALEEVLNNKQ